jgi:predicted deacylase
MAEDIEIGSRASMPGAIAVKRSTLRPAALHRFDYTCPSIDIQGASAGPRLCIMAGVHINEASSIVAATQLPDLIDTEVLRGQVSIIPVVSTHHLYTKAMVTPPTSGVDLHWSYPGDPAGEFNDALAHWLVGEWAQDADVFLDLHGGDLDERMARYVVTQRTGDDAFDSSISDLAGCFDTDLTVALAPPETWSAGRICTALARDGRRGMVVEAGDHGHLDRDSVDWLTKGVMNVMRHLNMLRGDAEIRGNRTVLGRYEWVVAPMAGVVLLDVNPGDHVTQGDRIGIITDLFGAATADVHAAASGHIMMLKTPLFAQAGEWIGAIASET